MSPAPPPSAPPPDAPGPGTPPPVEWSSSGGERVRVVVHHLVAGVLLATGLLALLVVAFVIVSSVRSGASDRIVLFVVLALVGGPLSLVYLAVAAEHGDPGRLIELFPPATSLRPRWLAVTVPVGVLLVFAGFAYPPLLAAYLGGFLLLAVAGSALFPEGRLDPAAGTLAVPVGDREHEHDLSGLRSVSTLRVGDVVLCRLGYAGVRGLSAPFLIGVPADRSDEIRRGLEAIRGRTDVEAAGQSRAVVAVLVAFGGFFLLVALGMGVLSWRSGEPSLTVYGGLMTGGLGLLFVWLGRVSRR
ncbi:hypothetical protein HUG10_10745 [Halorarum halophilum]|uniref:Uncharacterized protein n=1 Tax=Halorarum halophilum TaxID=2743090 RepID=A0A7D5K1L8_9EURY|nr:hypothetical protein [Halobaculum halophilum]QLG28001.1 hypothetical protein HUG10_10745 [Halobaculum halophilum]